MLSFDCSEPSPFNAKDSKTRGMCPTFFELKNQHSTIAVDLLACYRSAHVHERRFLYLIVMGDEKWYLYINIKQWQKWLSPNKQATPRTKQDQQPLTTMICVWWDWKGVIHYGLLERNQPVNLELYLQQMQWLNNGIQQKHTCRRYGVLLQYDNVRPYIAKIIKMAIQILGLKVLLSIFRTLSDFHLFRSFSNDLCGVLFNNDVELGWSNSSSRYHVTLKNLFNVREKS